MKEITHINKCRIIKPQTTTIMDKSLRHGQIFFSDSYFEWVYWVGFINLDTRQCSFTIP